MGGGVVKQRAIKRVLQGTDDPSCVIKNSGLLLSVLVGFAVGSGAEESSRLLSLPEPGWRLQKPHFKAPGIPVHRKTCSLHVRLDASWVSLGGKKKKKKKNSANTSLQLQAKEDSKAAAVEQHHLYWPTVSLGNPGPGSQVLEFAFLFLPFLYTAVGLSTTQVVFQYGVLRYILY